MKIKWCVSVSEDCFFFANSADPGCSLLAKVPQCLAVSRMKRVVRLFLPLFVVVLCWVLGLFCSTL